MRKKLGLPLMSGAQWVLQKSKWTTQPPHSPSILMINSAVCYIIKINGPDSKRQIHDFYFKYVLSKFTWYNANKYIFKGFYHKVTIGRITSLLTTCIKVWGTCLQCSLSLQRIQGPAWTAIGHVPEILPWMPSKISWRSGNAPDLNSILGPVATKRSTRLAFALEMWRQDTDKSQIT